MYIFYRKQTMSGFSTYKLAQWPNLISHSKTGIYVEQSSEVYKKKYQIIIRQI